MSQAEILDMKTQTYIGWAVTDKEFEAMRKKKLSSSLLISIRWVIVLQAAIQFVPSSPERCTTLIVLNDILWQVGALQTSLFAAWRVFALWDRRGRYTLSLLVFTFGVLPIATNTVRILTHTRSSQHKLIVGLFSIFSSALIWDTRAHHYLYVRRFYAFRAVWGRCA
ncbi:uncharacterized protein PHACADRAFT_33257 [Phanerochaete carnosa HHB-10118-sp]|uniref:Uncharacterized protein n=1 Tax=Phanerochaete carnosa (strain HHB-10118-sp) TaxID=650164 RepID=K5VSD9_PHACS|nr:uncharacterized protein PHACADRAFT_33257 [Phanerochaete carnosa HHB-10118-sp]EKM49690.1 hypothetical protein PHACADRAFT_33257 [Phanerochaete carnosa HHB-10118-sp]